ncbi:MAG: hypothetical protein DRP02_00300 [Candidatus Gerdarchaeota archaeon]|nr:MAG: hypothetical protein DRO63_04325 [Candidatus Gerdarchaeota archaeon]RLI72852.1 MAG: hypothetical protein DRP02_00300 [Candidatus Gerdarchaeota archaeon]
MLMIVTRLTPIIGYDKAGEITKKAYEANKSIREVIQELAMNILGDLDELLGPNKMV